MRLLHTSDWHLGHRFYGRKRHEEQGRFLDWLAGLIEEQGIDVLLVAGDIFDTAAPSSRALTLYYRFLHRLAGSVCRHVVLIGGNHDSPALLEAPRELLRQLQIHVVGSVGDNLEKEILLLRDQSDRPELLIGAVPFLRDRDIRNSAAGESLEEKGLLLQQSIREHYQQICQAADRMRCDIDPALPLVVMGHLFVAGGKTVEGDGVRELSIGGLGRIEGTAFPESIDYLALGHLHLPQQVAGAATRRYCGAPLPMSFNEADQRKQILAIRSQGRVMEVEPIPVPSFQQLISLRGELPVLLSGLAQLKASASSAWLELHYEGQEVIPNLRQQLLAAVEGAALSILRIRNNRMYDYALQQAQEAESLDDLSVAEVFERCLESGQLAEGQQQSVREAFAEITAALAQNDHEAD